MNEELSEQFAFGREVGEAGISFEEIKDGAVEGSPSYRALLAGWRRGHNIEPVEIMQAEW